MRFTSHDTSFKEQYKTLIPLYQSYHWNFSTLLLTCRTTYGCLAINLSDKLSHFHARIIAEVISDATGTAEKILFFKYYVKGIGTA